MIDPVLLKIGSLEIRYYGILFALGFLIGYFIIKKIGKEFGFKDEETENLSIYMVISAIIGARLFEVLFYDPSYYFSNPIKIFYIWEGGLASHGALISLIVFTVLYAKRKKINFYKISDLYIIPISLVAAFVRIGNFINGELVGKITSVLWAVKFANYEGLRHPVQFYQSFYYLIIFLILFNLRKIKNYKEGLLFWSFLFLDGTLRFITEFFKDLPKDYGFYFLGLNLAQYVSLIMILISIIPLYKRFKQ